MRRLLVAVYFLGISYATSAPVSENRWTAARVIGLHLQLVDENRTEEYWFTKNSVVPNVSSHDIVVNPLWRWKIHDGRLQIFSESQLERELTLISIDAKIIIVRTGNGHISRYRYSYNKWDPSLRSG